MRGGPAALLCAVLLALAVPGSTGAAAPTEYGAALADAVAAAAPQSALIGHDAPAALRAAYAADAPLWLHAGRAGSQAQLILHELQRADAYGLEAHDYALGSIGALTADPDVARLDPVRAARLDVELSVATLHFVSDLHYGRVTPARAGFNLEGTRAVLDLATALRSLSGSANVSATLASFEPPFHHYALLRLALTRYLSLAQQPGLTQLPAPPRRLRIGERYAGTGSLRKLLLALGDLTPAASAPAGEVFDAELSAAVRAFQLRHGLAPDGLLGKMTFAALTTPLAQRVRQIELTLERWRWLPAFKTPPIIVNIPQFRLFAFRTTDDRAADILQMDVIVGRTFPRMQTPVFESGMRYLVFRPYWDVPASIVTNELLPKIRANASYLTTQHLELVRGQQDSSPVVAATPDNIAALGAGELRLRQLPGEDNALGLIKFIFPNSYNVYLHSTPAHQLFQESRRAFSHGCIRVSDPRALAAHVLRNAPGDWTKEKIAAAMSGDTPALRVNLPQPIDVLILYGTALATEAGPTLFFEDIYGYDVKLERQLHLAPVR